jgi:hypothetical protein
VKAGLTEDKVVQDRKTNGQAKTHKIGKKEFKSKLKKKKEGKKRLNGKGKGKLGKTAKVKAKKHKDEESDLDYSEEEPSYEVAVSKKARKDKDYALLKIEKIIANLP